MGLGLIGKAERLGVFKLLDRLPLTGPHYANLTDIGRPAAGKLKSASSWDQLRSTDSVYGLPDTREEWDASVPAWLTPWAQDVVDIAREHGATSIASYGVGAAFLEHEMARFAPDIRLACSDFSPATIARLRRLFPEAEVLEFDLLHDQPLAADLTLLHRVDAEFTNRQWRRILRRLEGRLVLFLPGEMRRTVEMARMLAARAKERSTVTRAGRSRTRPVFERLLGNTAVPVRVGDLDGWLRKA